jgi:hypothetical protein
LKRILPLLVLALLAGCATVGDRETLRFDGEFGPLILDVDWDRGRFTGRSPDTEGRLSGNAVRTRNGGGTLTGIWTQPRSDQRCDTTRNGSAYWGQFLLNLDGDYEPEAYWGYCNEPPRREWELELDE